MKSLAALSLAPMLESAVSVIAQPKSTGVDSDGPNIIILLFDTLAARNMSLYGYRRATVPNMATFADQATVYHSHHATGNFTTPATASLFTGVYPWTHRAFHYSGNVAEAFLERHLLSLLPDRYHRLLFPHHLWIDLMLRQFRDKGRVQYVEPPAFSLSDRTFPDLGFRDMETAQRAFDDLLFRTIGLPGSLVFGLGRELGALSLRKRFDRDLAEQYPRGVPTLGMYDTFYLLEDIIDGIQGLLSRVPSPFLAYFHVYPPHDPYCARSDFVGIFEDGWKPAAKPVHPLSQDLPQEQLDRDRVEYDEYVAFVDSEFGRLYDFLATSGILESSYLVVTSDHGEMFERGVLKHVTETLYQPVIHVPLLISAPGQRQRVDIYDHTSGVDLMPTLLRALNLPVPQWCEGRALPLTNAGAESDERPIFSLEAKSNPAYAPLSTYTATLIRGRHKLIYYAGYDKLHDVYELYDLVNDPEERENLSSARPSVASDLAAELRHAIEDHDIH